MWQIFLVSIIPGLLWLWFFCRQDVYEPEPRRLLFLLFVLSMLGVIPAFLLELPWHQMYLNSLQQRDLVKLAIFFFVIIGGTEETIKLLILHYFLRRQPEFDEPLDGMIYGVTVGLGFAALENLLYAAAGRGWGIGLYRALVTSLAHASFTGWIGYYLSVAKFSRRSYLIPFGLLLAIAMHGSYDFILLSGIGIAGLGSFLLVGISMALLLYKMRQLESWSPFRPPGS